MTVEKKLYGEETPENWKRFKYFTDNKERMKDDTYRVSRLPIGSGTVVMRTHGGITLFSRCRQDAASSFESALPEGSPRWKEGCRVA